MDAVDARQLRLTISGGGLSFSENNAGLGWNVVLRDNVFKNNCIGVYGSVEEASGAELRGRR